MLVRECQSLYRPMMKQVLQNFLIVFKKEEEEKEEDEEETKKEQKKTCFLMECGASELSTIF